MATQVVEVRKVDYWCLAVVIENKTLNELSCVRSIQILTRFRPSGVHFLIALSPNPMGREVGGRRVVEGRLECTSSRASGFIYAQKISFSILRHPANLQHQSPDQQSVHH